jgi:hypothetical protein
LCRQTLSENPLGGAVYVFRNRTGTTLKLLAYDGQGFWLCTKRGSVASFHFGDFPLSFSTKSEVEGGNLINFKGSQFEKEIILWGYGGM